MQTTANFGLKKPEANDFYDFEMQNDNLDEIDRVLKECEDGTKNVSALTTNLLNPKLTNYESGGITVANNGDGTYTVNGTATERNVFALQADIVVNDKQLKLVGCPSGGSVDTYYLAVGTLVSNMLCVDSGSGDISDEPLTSDKTYRLYLVTEAGTVCDNLVFKPMLTPNLNATYDDFVSYTGNTGKLNGDVAEIRKDNPTWIALTEGFDLNNALGKYRTPSGAVIKTLVNLPSAWTNGELSIDWIPFDSTNVYGMQILTYKSGSNLSIYHRAKNSSTWGDWQQYLHTGNKPTGTYTGNGSATERIIAVGGIGSAVVITNNSNYDIAVLYPTSGYTGHKSNVFTSGTGAYLNANNCDITLKTADALLNASGVTYRWRVI